MRRSASCVAVILIAAMIMCGCDTEREHLHKKNYYDIKRNYVSPKDKPNDRTGMPKSGETEPVATVDPADVTLPTYAATPIPTPTPTPAIKIGHGRKYIYDIADMDWARQNVPYFEVSTPEQLAGAVRFYNEEYQYNESSITISLLNDLDLDGYEWVPLNNFAGNIDGRGHTIRNIHLNNPTEPRSNHNGIIGCNGGAIGIFDLRVENAEVNGGEYVGIFVGEGYMLNLVNVYASGSVNSSGNNVGALIGRTSPSTTYDSCSMDVTVNGYTSQYFSYTQQNEADAEKFAKDIYTLTLKDDHTVVRDEVPGHRSRNLTWRVIYEGEIVLGRNAENETEYKYFRSDPGRYKIYLTEFSSEFGGYIRVSNEVEYTIE